MAILDFIKGLFKKEEDLAQKSVQKLMTMTPEERDREQETFSISSALIMPRSSCTKKIHRQGSPFVDLPRDHFFYEILLMNFWMVDKVLRNIRPVRLTTELHQRYFGMLPEAAEAAEEHAKEIQGLLC